MKTIKDIAEEAEVSTGTVDRVIHNRPGVSLKTKTKIQKLLKKYNFETNLLASTLASQKKYVIVALIPLHKSKKDYWYEPKKGVKIAFKEIRKYGVEAHCIHFDQFDLNSYKKGLDQILKINPDGVVLAPFFYNTSSKFSKVLDEKNIPYVYINIDLEEQKNLSFIGQDSFNSGYLCGKMMNLCVNETTHLAILLSKKNVDNHRAIEDRVKGFLNYFSQKNTNRVIKKIFFESMEIEQVRKVLTKELIKDNEIKGLFIPSSSAHIVGDFLESIDLTHIRVIGFDAHQNNIDYIKKGIIDFAIDQNPFDQGYVGVKILFEYLLLRKEPNPKYNSPMTIVTKENVDYFNVMSLIEFAT